MEKFEAGYKKSFSQTMLMLVVAIGFSTLFIIGFIVFFFVSLGEEFDGMYILIFSTVILLDLGIGYRFFGLYRAINERLKNGLPALVVDHHGLWVHNKNKNIPVSWSDITEIKTTLGRGGVFFILLTRHGKKIQFSATMFDMDGSEIETALRQMRQRYG